MGYNTLGYLVLFLPAVLIGYAILPQKGRKYFLLAASWVYFFLLSHILIVYLIGTIVFVYFSSHIIDRAEKKSRRRKRLFFCTVFLLFFVLLVLKYSGFFIRNLNQIGGFRFDLPHFWIPIGISFYTLEAVGYLVEVYWGRLAAETDFIRLALFLSFFPQTMEGPIALYADTAEQLTKGEALSEKNLRNGGVRILFGLMKKIVIADRLNTVVSVLFSNYTSYSGFFMLLAALSYTIQLYMEFSGVMDIVNGSAQLFGISLPENFRRPFFAKNAAEFWRRWHITLGKWLKAYIFYPVSTSGIVKKWNKYARKNLGKQWAKVGMSALALFPVWLFNGLWHGPQWNYIFYGMYYFVILMLEIIAEPAASAFLKLVHASEEAWWWNMLRIGKTWIIIFTGELFFRAEGLRAGLAMFGRLFYHFTLRPLTDGSILKLGLDHADWMIIGLGIILVCLFDLQKERGHSILGFIDRQKLPVRWAIYYAAIFFVIIFGAYGYGYQQVDLIYAGF